MYYELVTRSDATDLLTGSLRDAGHLSFYWSSVAYLNISNAYRLLLSNTDTYLSNYGVHWNSFPLRCQNQ